MRQNNESRPATKPAPDNSMSILAMLESLSDAIESRADEVDSESRNDELRATVLRDVSQAIKDRFGF